MVIKADDSEESEHDSDEVDDHDDEVEDPDYVEDKSQSDDDDDDDVEENVEENVEEIKHVDDEFQTDGAVGDVDAKGDEIRKMPKNTAVSLCLINGCVLKDRHLGSCAFEPFASGVKRNCRSVQRGSCSTASVQPKAKRPRKTSGTTFSSTHESLFVMGKAAVTQERTLKEMADILINQIGLAETATLNETIDAACREVDIERFGNLRNDAKAALERIGVTD